MRRDMEKRPVFLLISVTCYLHLNRMAYEKNNPGKIEGDQNLYRNILQYIDDHLEEDLSLEFLAGEFYVSKYHIAHIFKENTGISIHQYI